MQHFLEPRRFEDPFGNATSVDYDADDILVAQTTDAVGNTLIANNDYRVLAPALLADPNGNRTAVSYDALGMVAGTAVMGKQTENLGDSLAGFAADLTQTQIDSLYSASDPHQCGASPQKKLNRFHRLAAYNSLGPEGIEFGCQAELQFSCWSCAANRYALELCPWRRELVADGEQAHRTDGLRFIDQYLEIIDLA